MITEQRQIPSSVHSQLACLPSDRPVCLLLRHAERESLAADDAGFSLPITQLGQRLARELGSHLRDRLRTVHSSPFVRCVQTGQCMREGAGADAPIVLDPYLGAPGVYVADAGRAWPNWHRLGPDGVIHHLLTEADPLPGMARTDEAARWLVQHMLALAEETGIHVFVSHDYLVSVTAARLQGRDVGHDGWPDFLDGAFFWRDGSDICVTYRQQYVRHAAPLCALVDADIIEFARREVGATIGLHSGVRFFLAGGAFKSLLTGRPPRDLDLWAPSASDRAGLLNALRNRGARPLHPRPFADAFEIAGRVVEVPHAAGPPTLAQRLHEFDIALSAVGVEHRPDDDWSAVIHPLALESVRRRELRLLKPLFNWRYALTTLERMRRYAVELGYSIPEEEEAEIWRVLEAQPSDGRDKIVDRYRRTSSGGFGVMEDFECRFR